MNKTMMSLALLCLSSNVLAGTLSPVLCGTNPVKCSNVPNSDGPLVDIIQYDYLHGRVAVTIGWSRYESGLWAVPTNALSWTNLVLTDQTGNQILFTASFYTWATGTTGRLRTTHWGLASGTIQ